ncbi:MAG: glycosyltransferase family 2 protein [Victivallaceae bacterium]|nr:glycosyltransferase family 2 protein [Victivallaceae bacterium]
MKIKVAVIIPCFNEQDNIVNVIDDILNNTPKNEDWQAIVVNDCSTDETFAKLQADGRAVILDLPCNLGVGAAVQTGFRYACENNFDFALKLDGDGQHRADYIPALLEVLKNDQADFVVGSRFVEDSKKGFKSTSLRRVGIKFFRLLIKSVSGYTSSDPTSGFRAYNRKALKFAIRYYPSFDYPEPEEIVLMKKNNFRIKDIFTEMRERQGGVSSISSLKAVYYMFKVGFAILMVALRPKEKDFSL